MKLRVHVDELRGLAPEIAKAMDAAVDAGVERAAIVLEKEMKQIVSIDGGRIGKKRWKHSPPGSPPFKNTGHLGRGITHEPIRAHSTRVGTTVEYGQWVNDGTSRMAPRPFLVPSLRLASPRMESGANKAFSKKWDESVTQIIARLRETAGTA